MNVWLAQKGKKLGHIEGMGGGHNNSQSFQLGNSNLQKNCKTKEQLMCYLEIFLVINYISYRYLFIENILDILHLKYLTYFIF